MANIVLRTSLNRTCKPEPTISMLSGLDYYDVQRLFVDIEFVAGCGMSGDSPTSSTPLDTRPVMLSGIIIFLNSVQILLSTYQRFTVAFFSELAG